MHPGLSLLSRRLILCVSAFTMAFVGLSFAGPAGTDEVVRAQLTPRRIALLSAEMGAKIRKVHVKESDAFNEGDPLVSFDDALQRAQVERAKAVLAAAEKTYAANQRLQTLNSVGQIELDVSEAEVSKARAELSYALAMLARCEIVAPFSGRVSELRVHDQEFVQAGQPLCEIIDQALPQIEFIAPSRWLAWLRIGQPLEIKIEETGRSYPALLERIGAKVDAVSQSIKVTAGVRGAFPELMAGMSGTIVITPPTSP